jgi:spore maturation protein CgeB
VSAAAPPPLRLARLHTAYPDYLASFYAARPVLLRAGFAEQKAALDLDAFGWGDAWAAALAPLGYEVLEICANAEPLQRAWAREHAPHLAGGGLEAIALAQLRDFAPEVLWFDHHDEALLDAVRVEVPSLRRALGWVGAHVPAARTWRGLDLVLSCSVPSVDALRARGVRAELLRHAFDERVIPRLGPPGERFDAVFVGQFDPDAPTHALRERLVERLVAEAGIAVFSPSGAPGAASRWRRRAHALAWDALGLGRRLGVPGAVLERLPLIGRAAAWPARPRVALPGALASVLRPPRFGLEMYRTLRDARIVLDVQGDPERRDSSNMRLFEATGVGACLLTDRSARLSEMFEPEREVATYSSDDECVAKLRRLLANEAERDAIARAGEKRTRRDHTFARRAARLDELVRGALA